MTFQRLRMPGWKTLVTIWILSLGSCLGLVWIVGLDAPALELEVVSPERFKVVVTTNSNLPSRFREKWEHRSNGAESVQAVRLPLGTHRLEQVNVELRPIRKDVPTPLMLKLARVRSSTGRIWKEEAVSGIVWNSGNLPQSPFLTAVRTASPAGIALMVVSGLGLFLSGWLLILRLRKTASGAPGFLWGIAGGFVMGGGAYGAAMVWQQGRWLPSESWVNDLTVHKLEVAGRHPSPRLLCFGGSSGLYGIDAAWLSREAGHPVVNLALHAGLPLEYQFRWARENLKPGDEVLLQLEFAYWNEESPTGWQVDQMHAWAYQGLSKERFGMGFIPLLTHTSPERLAGGLISKVLLGKDSLELVNQRILPDGRWENYFGDIPFPITEFGDRSPEGPVSGIHPAPDSYQVGKKPLEPDSLPFRLIREFSAEMVREGRRVYLVFPATIASGFADFRQPGKKRWMDDLIGLLEEAGITVLGRPEEMQLPLSAFLDSDYHLKPEARTIHTKRVYEFLRGSGWTGSSIR